MPPPVRRISLIRAIEQAERTLRWGGSLLVVPGWIRVRLLEQANALARLLVRLGRR